MSAPSLYSPCLTLYRVKCVFTPFDGVDQFSMAAVDKYEQAILRAEREGTKVRALMLCNPHNPLGQCYPRDTIIGLMKLCQKHQIHLLADEVYVSIKPAPPFPHVCLGLTTNTSKALSVYDVGDPIANPFTSVLSIPNSSDYISPTLLHILYGFSKDFASGGLRLGCIYIPANENLLTAMGAITQFHWSGSMNETLGTLMLEDEKWLEDFTALSQKRLAERNLLVRAILEDKSISYSRGSNAGFFIWVDLRPFLPTTGAQGEEIVDQWEREAELVRRMTEKKVYFTDGQSLSAEAAGWFRVIFSQEEDVVKEGFRRLFEVLGI